MPPLLEVFLHRRCPSEHSALHLLAHVRAALPSCRIEVHPLSGTRAAELGITMDPSFVLDGRRSPRQGLAGDEDQGARFRETAMTIGLMTIPPAARWVVLGSVGLVLILAWVGLRDRAMPRFDLTTHTIPLDQIVSGGPGKDGIPALLNPTFVSADAATFLEDDDRVLGFSDSLEAKAYPVRILNWHEIVNDHIADRPILITYCPLCGTGMAFDPVAPDGPLTFGVSGLLYQSDLLMYDHRTESLWSQLAMQAVTGSLAGTRLRPLPLEHTTWVDWRHRNPHTLVLSTDTGYLRDYSRDPYDGYAQRNDLMFGVTHFDPEFLPKEWILGIELGDAARAYPFSRLQSAPTPLTDRVNGHPIVIHFDPIARSARVTDEHGSPVPSVMAYWFAWYAFHPDTTVYTGRHTAAP